MPGVPFLAERLGNPDFCQPDTLPRPRRPGGPRTPEILSRPTCDPFQVFQLPTPLSEPPGGGNGGLRAGFAKVDITPPPGLGLLGWGPEAKTGAGHRNRLYVRVMVLRDSRGEQLALGVMDLDAVSGVLHREAADRLHDRTNGAIGADRLILSATHTHSGPGHFLSAWPLNMLGGSPAASGFDDAFVAWLADRVAEAVTQALRALAPARAGWAVAPIWGETRNRNYAGYRRDTNIPDLRPAPPPALDDTLKAVDPRWWMLRVDVERDGAYVPAGALSIFGIHGTGFPAGNDLYDGDIHAVVSRRIDRTFGPGFVHLFANGAEGDVSPNWPENTRCPPPTFGPGTRPVGPRSPAPMVDWQDPSDRAAGACLRAARAYVDRVSAALAAHAVSLFQGLEPRLTDDVTLARAFETFQLTGAMAQSAGLCERPQVGTSLVAGGRDGPTRYAGWRVFGLIPLGIESGGHAVDPGRTDCQGPKRVLVPLLQSNTVGPFQFPEYAQLAVVRVGGVLIATVPAEVSTVAALRMLAGVREGWARTRGVDATAIPADSLAFIGLANGYLSYITTHEEYQVQSYEGGSNLYGPNTARVLADRLEALARSHGATTGPTVDVGPFLVRPGSSEEIVARPDSTRPRPTSPAILETRCAANTPDVVVRWIDKRPGDVTPADGLMVEFARITPATSVVDDDLDVEVRSVRDVRTGHVWQARWLVPGGVQPGDRFEIQLLRWPGRPAVACP